MWPGTNRQPDPQTDTRRTPREAPRAHRQHRRTAEHLAGQGGPADNNFVNINIKTDKVVAHNSTILSI